MAARARCLHQPHSDDSFGNSRRLAAMNNAADRKHEAGDGRIRRLEEDVSDLRLMLSLIALVLTIAIWLSPWGELPVLPYMFLPVGVLAFWSIMFEFIQARKRPSTSDHRSAVPANPEIRRQPVA